MTEEKWMNCGQCNGVVAKTAQQCPHCGHQFLADAFTPGMRKFLFVVFVLLALALFVLLI